MIKTVKPLGFPWQTQDPFLFCAYHRDEYPIGNEEMQPVASLEGRNLGQDFTIKDGWRMYHGQSVPGFPSHPHRGFETISITKEGMVDHSDSLGAAGRFGDGDVQWMTAGKGVQHAEMFPLLHTDKNNPLEIFQVWLNLPSKDKMVDPHFAMLWNEDVPIFEVEDAKGLKTKARLICGNYQNKKMTAATPNSWAADESNDVNILTLELAPHATWRFPASTQTVNRSLFFYKGDHCYIGANADDTTPVQVDSCIELEGSSELVITNGKESSFFLFLQGKPISEPVAKYGPFVMNNQKELMDAISEFQQTQFGGWPWPATDHVHDRTKGRFALHENGKLEER